MCSECLGQTGLWENKEDWCLKDLRLTDRYNTVVSFLPSVDGDIESKVPPWVRAPHAGGQVRPLFTTSHKK